MRDERFLKAEVARADTSLWLLKLESVFLSSDISLRTGISLWETSGVLLQSSYHRHLKTQTEAFEMFHWVKALAEQAPQPEFNIQNSDQRGKKEPIPQSCSLASKNTPRQACIPSYLPIEYFYKTLRPSFLIIIQLAIVLSTYDLIPSLGWKTLVFKL